LNTLDKIAYILNITDIKPMDNLTIETTSAQMWDKAKVLAEWVDEELSLGKTERSLRDLKLGGEKPWDEAENYRRYKAGLSYRAKDGSYVPGQGFGLIGEYK